MNILGIDYGRKKIGLAISQHSFPEPFLVLRLPKNNDDRFSYFSEKIAEISQKQGIGKIVLGFSSSNSDFEKEIKKFAELLKKKTGVEVELFEESMTTKEAQKLMIEIGHNRKKRRLREDAIAAAFLLKDYLSQNS